MVVTSLGFAASRVMVSWLFLPHTRPSDQVCNFPTAASLQQLPTAVHSRSQTLQVPGLWKLLELATHCHLALLSGNSNPLLPTTHAFSTHSYVQFSGSWLHFIISWGLHMVTLLGLLSHQVSCLNTLLGFLLLLWAPHNHTSQLNESSCSYP